MSLADALAYVKQRRSIVNPNIGFMNQLEELDVEAAVGRLRERKQQ